MEADIDSPNSGSPLSDMDSDDFPEDVKFHDPPRSRASTISASDDDLASHSSVTASRVFDMPPAKRRKTGLSSYDHATPQSGSTAAGGRSRSRSPTGSISSDSSGSVPTSPSHANLGPTHPLSTAYAAAQANPENPEMADYVQVTRCLWDGCTNQEQGNMDNLVTHINDVHIVPRQKKYYCEWEGCPRKGQPHTSAYALKAHMRSHTKEKPFMCSLPECDRSFTRSDALAKHMRTVHETEALRPSDPVPRGHTGGISNGGPASNTIKRLKLTMGGKANGDKKAALVGDLPELPTRYTVAMMGINPDDVEMADPDASDELADAVDVDSVPLTLPLPADYWPAEIWEGMDEYERTLPPSQYFRLLRRQIRWAEEEGRELQRELEDLRSTVEDSQGNLIKRGAGDEKGADENRRLEWQQVEDLLDTILRAECTKVFESLGTEKPPGVKEMDPWDLVKSLPRTLPQLTATDI